jgi:hypothetical protein
VAAEQVKAFMFRSSEERATPLFVFDAGYDPIKVQRGLEGSPCQILLRLRAGRCFFADPSLAGPPAQTGRPRRHGPRMKCSDPSTWPGPSADYACEDAGYGAVRVRAWAKMHPKVCAHEGRGSRGPLAIVVGTLVLVEVGRLPRGERRREPKELWLWWDGPSEELDLDLLWRAYIRRFDLEHTFRFLKQSMGWTTPRVRHPEQADRWTVEEAQQFLRAIAGDRLEARSTSWPSPRASGAASSLASSGRTSTWSAAICGSSAAWTLFTARPWRTIRSVLPAVARPC